MKILCSGYLVRYPIGGMSWHHLQYLLGFKRFGCEVSYFEHYGWPRSCYDPCKDEMVRKPVYGLDYVSRIFQLSGLDCNWCYIGENGDTYGVSRDELAQICNECDVYFNLSNINWIPELELCRSRVLVDTDPVFTQIGTHGFTGSLPKHHVFFTYGENVHKPGCDMPTLGINWHPIRQPVVLDLWPSDRGREIDPLTTLINWSTYDEIHYNGRSFGQKDREFKPYISLPKDAGENMEIAINAPKSVQKQLTNGGWRLANPLEVSRDLWTYQSFIQRSKGEFCVAKHGYVVTNCGWFSDRSSGYLASGRPVILQDTGFSEHLPCGEGLLKFNTAQEAIAAIKNLDENYEEHCIAARKLAQEYFDSQKLLKNMLELSV